MIAVEDTFKKIIECMNGTLEGCRETLRNKALEMADTLKEILEATDEELPLLLGQTKEQSDEFADIDYRELIEQRMKGENVDTPENWILALSDCEFSYDDAKEMAENDGNLFLLIRLFRIVGDEDRVKQAEELVYQDN